MKLAHHEPPSPSFKLDVSPTNPPISRSKTLLEKNLSKESTAAVTQTRAKSFKLCGRATFEAPKIITSFAANANKDKVI